jgi:hypothetical protein
MDDVIAHPDVSEPEVFRSLRDATDGVRATGAAVLRQVDADAHA